jgi:small subunit ribosomal protein S13
MVYILSINFKNNKRVCLELPRLYGVGKYQAHKLCNKLNIGLDGLIHDITQANLYFLLKQIEQERLIIETDLHKQKRQRILDLIELKSYKAIKHVFNLPVRRSRTNIRFEN